MKKILISLSLLLVLNSTYSQNREVMIDKCTNKSEVNGPTGVICSNDLRTKWFTLVPKFKLDGDRLSMSGLLVIGLNIGSLSKSDKLCFSFKDGTKLRLDTDVELTIDGCLFFKLTDFEFSILKMRDIETVRYINGIDYNSFQYIMNGNEESNYYVNLFTNYYIREVYCD